MTVVRSIGARIVFRENRMEDMILSKNGVLMPFRETLDLKSCLDKQDDVKKLFSDCFTKEDKYRKIIELGEKLSPADPAWCTEENIVHGCQSTLYLKSYLDGDKVVFQASTEALISAGLASLLIDVYSHEPPAAILKCPPTFLDELDIYGSLSPSRSNGLLSMYRRMKQDALKYFIELNKI
jgi:sulfur transfer protein SufE